LREVAKEPTTTSMWSKFEYLYMTKSLAHRQVLKQQLYSFKMVESKATMERILEFSKTLDDLEIKVMFLTLGVMPGGAVVVWSDVKHSTSAWRGGGKNTHDQSREAEARILMIYLLRSSFKVEDIVGCTHLLVERLEAQL